MRISSKDTAKGEFGKDKDKGSDKDKGEDFPTGKGKHTAKGKRGPISMPVSAYRFYNALSRFDFIVRL